MSRAESRFRNAAMVAASALLCAVPASVSALDIAPESAGQVVSLASSGAQASFDRHATQTCALLQASGTQGSLQPAPNARQEKSTAILGGMSALEMMKSEQVTFARPVTSETRDSGQNLTMAMTLEPAIGGYIAQQAECAARAQGKAMVKPGMNRPVAGAPRAGSPLQSRRVPIGTTPFDAQWQRVSRGSLSDRQFSRIIGQRPARGMELLTRVNAWVNNNVTYVEDSRLWGSPDYWATASETLSRSQGDCEDLAIVKMKILERAGISRQDMFLTVARDLYRNADHAFLVVKLDGQFFVLDNAVDRVLPGDQDLGYQPVLSFSSYNSWLHGY